MVWQARATRGPGALPLEMPRPRRGRASPKLGRQAARLGGKEARPRGRSIAATALASCRSPVAPSERRQRPADRWQLRPDRASRPRARRPGEGAPFLLCLGKPANGRRFPTAPTGRAPPGSLTTQTPSSCLEDWIRLRTARHAAGTQGGILLKNRGPMILKIDTDIRSRRGLGRTKTCPSPGRHLANHYRR